MLFLLVLLISFLLLLSGPVFHILGQWAGYRVLKGDNYHYPVIGRMVKKGWKNHMESRSLNSIKENS